MEGLTAYFVPEGQVIGRCVDHAHRRRHNSVLVRARVLCATRARVRICRGNERDIGELVLLAFGVCIEDTERQC